MNSKYFFEVIGHEGDLDIELLCNRIVIFFSARVFFCARSEFAFFFARSLSPDISIPIAQTMAHYVTKHRCSSAMFCPAIPSSVFILCTRSDICVILSSVFDVHMRISTSSCLQQCSDRLGSFFLFFFAISQTAQFRATFFLYPRLKNEFVLEE